MSVFPIVDRELRVAARRSKTYWLRVGGALAALLICLWMVLWAGRGQAPGTAGKSLFAALTILSFSYCLLVGPFITADCVSEEKREGTLGLLFLTNLRSLDVLLGKWVASSLTGFYGLLAILPALGLPLLMGGVTPGEYGRSALAILNAVLFSLTAGMFASSFSKDQAKAVLGSVILVLGLSGLLPGIATALSTAFFTKPLTFPTVVLASPVYTGYCATDSIYRATPRNFWMSLALVHSLCWLFMLATAAWLPRVWREDPAEKPVEHRWLWRFGYTQRWRRLFASRLERNPVFALAARLRWPHVVFWCLVTLVMLNVYWLSYGYRRSPSSYQFHLYFSHALVFTNRVWLTVMACRFFLEAQRTGALELMLTTPLTPRTILRGHWRALWRYFFLPVSVIALLHVFYVAAGFSSGPPGAPGARPMVHYYLLGAGGSFFRFITDVVALSWVGAWLSLSSRKSTLALLKTFGYVILIPWAIAYFCPSIPSLLSQPWGAAALRGPLGQFLLTNSVLFSYVGAPACWVLKNLGFVLWARHMLRKHFRVAASQHQVWRVWPFRWRPFRGQHNEPIQAVPVTGT
jgi:ABC-type transport system involved in multi-copper enzyme maturation permease subunit